MSRRRTRGRVVTLPWAFLAAVGLVILTECGFGARELDLAMRETLGTSYAARAARDPGRDASVLAMGDSLIKYGVLPRVIQDRTGRTTRNIAVAGGNPPVTHLLFEQALAHGRKPEVVVVDFKPSQLQADPKDILPGLAAESTVWQWLDLARTCRDPVLFARLVTNGVLPSLRYRVRVRQAVTGALAGRPLSGREENLALLRTWGENLGAEIQPKNPTYEPAASHWDDPYYLPEFDWYCHPLNSLYIDRFLKLAAASQVRVVWVAPPINPRVQAGRDARGLDAGFTRMLRNAVRRFPGLTVVDARHSGYPVDVFHDGAHLDGDGALAFSGQVAEVLGPLLTRPAYPPRWVDLAAYTPLRPGPSDRPMAAAPPPSPALRR